MITLSENFRQRVENNDTRKIVFVHIYYNDSDYFALSTTQTIIDGKQYLGIINNVSDITQRWNLGTEKNNVTVSTPRLTLSNYQTPDGFEIINEFIDKHIYGRKLVIYLTFEGLNLQDSLKVFEGLVDDVNFDKNSIIITGKTNQLPEKEISGAKIDYDNQTIGDEPVPTGFKILKEFDKKHIPIVFGKHWCSPIIPYMQNNSSDWQRYFASIDHKYSDNIVVQSNIRLDNIHYNLDKTGSSILIFNDDYFTPLYDTDYTSSILKVYNLTSPGPDYYPGITLKYQGGHTKQSEDIFLTVPLKYEVRSDLPNWFQIDGAQYYDTPTTVSNVFNNDDTAPYLFKNARSSWLRLWVKTKLDLNKNLRVDESGHIRKNRRIHIPSTESNNGGQGYLLGRWEINIGALGYFHDNIWVTVDLYPFVMHHWKDGYSGEPFDFAARSLPIYIGAGTVGLLTPDDCKIEPYNYMYNQQARIFTNQQGANFFDFGEVDSNRRIGLQGNEYITPEMGNSPFLNREAFTGDFIGAALEFYAAKINLFSPQTTDEVKLYKIYHVTAGSVDFKLQDSLYGATDGYTLTDSNSLVSTARDISNYMLKRPYEYIEFLLRKLGQSNFAANFNYSNINSAWESVFSTSRDYSGFFINKETTFNKFLEEYQRYEPFTVYVSEDDKFNIAVLKSRYTEDDIVDYLDYKDATDFNMSLTDTKDIVTEIKHLKTDYMPEIDDYVIDAHFRIDESQYDYAYWKANNTVSNNEFFLESVEKKYTSSTPVDIVSFNGKYYGCVRSCKQIPPSNRVYWTELAEPKPGSPLWDSEAFYKGEDAEAYMLAKFILNYKANRHRVVTFETDNLDYLRFSVGDVVGFKDVPNTLVGLRIKGFAGAQNFTVTLNNQTIYSAFLITSIRKSIKKIEIEAIQLHDLLAYSITRV